MTTFAAIDPQEQVARIERTNAATRKFVEAGLKLSTESRKLARDHALAPLSVDFASMAVGVAFFGANAAFIRLIGP